MGTGKIAFIYYTQQYTMYKNVLKSIVDDFE